MGKVPMPQLVWIPSPNYTAGRQGKPIRKRTFHHVVGSADSAKNKFLIKGGISSHFIIGASVIYCMVDTNNTAYTNGNWASNLESVTMEHEGDWRNGFRSEAVINNSVRLNAWLLDLYPSTTFNRHREVATNGTVCPSDLPVEEIEQKARALRDSYYAPTPPPTPEWLKNRKPLTQSVMYAQVDGIRLWNLADTSKPSDTRTFARNTDFAIAGETTVGGVKYYITVYSMKNSVGAGFKASELGATPWTPPPPPTDTRPEWQKNLVDIPNRPMWATRQTQLIDLTTGRPVDGVAPFAQFAKLDDVSAQTVVGDKSFYLTEYSFSKKIGKGFTASDLSMTDPTPVVPPPVVTPPVVDPDRNAIIAFLTMLRDLITNFLGKFKK